MKAYLRMYAVVKPEEAGGELMRVLSTLKNILPDVKFSNYMTQPYWKSPTKCELFCELEYPDIEQVRGILGKGEWNEGVWNKMDWRKDPSLVQKGQVWLESDKVVWADLEEIP